MLADANGDGELSSGDFSTLFGADEDDAALLLEDAPGSDVDAETAATAHTRLAALRAHKETLRKAYRTSFREASLAARFVAGASTDAAGSEAALVVAARDDVAEPVVDGAALRRALTEFGR